MAKGTAYTDLTVFSPEGDDFTVTVEYNWWYDAGVWRDADGSGYPPDWGSEWKRYTSATTEPMPAWVTDDIVDAAFEQAELEPIPMDYEND